MNAEVVSEEEIVRHVAETLAGVTVVRPQPGDAPAIAVGDSFFIYDPAGDLEDRHRMPFATIVTKDYGDFDAASQLDRPGVFRLNVGLSPERYRAAFGEGPGPQATSGPDARWDFAALDRLMPHPVYAPQGWACVLNPSRATFEALRPLLAEAYERAVERVTRIRSRRGS